MIQLFIFLSLFGELANADTDFRASRRETTLCDWVDLTCCYLNQSMCTFYADSRDIGQKKSSNNCCRLTVSGEKLLNGKAEEGNQTTVIVHCEGNADFKSQNVTITVWRKCLSSKYILVFLHILGSLMLFSLLLSIIICIIYVIQEKGDRRKFYPVSYRTEVLDTDANSGTVEVQEEKTEIVEDELLYATVNHSGAGENSAPVVKFELGTDYATVVIH